VSLSLAAAVDDLYRDVVLDPHRWGDEAYAGWMADLALDGGVMDRNAARSIRRAVRIAGKLQRFWSSADADRYRDEPSWESRVDLAVGVPAWRPGLELAELELAVAPSPQSFEEVRRRFRIVNGTSWMEDVEFDDWIVRGSADQIG
jgi:hypothetical protein